MARPVASRLRLCGAGHGGRPSRGFGEGLVPVSVILALCLEPSDGDVTDSEEQQGKDKIGVNEKCGHATNPFKIRRAKAWSERAKKIQTKLITRMINNPGDFVQSDELIFADTGPNTPTAKLAVDARSSALANNLVCSLRTMLMAYLLTS